MFIKKLKIKNFLTIAEGELSLENRGLVLISGVNKDDVSAKSNGAGKSSIVDSICWCLFGSTARGESADDVVNNEAKKDCCVELTIQDNENEYVFVRYRKDTVNKSNVLIWQNGVELTAPTIAENDAKICKLIGMTKEIFQATVYCGQDSMPYLPAMTDKQIKELIENAAGLTQLQKAYALAREQKINNQSLSSSLLLLVENIKNDIEKLTANISILENERIVWDTQHSIDIKMKKAELDLRKSRYENEVNNFKAVYDNTLSNKIQDINGKINSPELVQKRKELADLELAKSGKQLEIASIDGNIKHKQTSIDNNLQEISEIKSGVKSKCPTCGRFFDKVDINSAIQTLKNNNDVLQKEIESLKADMLQAGVQYQNILSAIEDTKKQIPDTTELSKELQELNQKNLLQEQQLMRLQQKKSELINFKKECDEFEKLPNPKEQSLQIVKKMLEDKKQELKNKEEESQEVLKQLSVDNNLVSVFGPSGVRAHILDVITPYLNARTNRYLHTLSCGNLSAEWSTLSTTKSNVVKEKFSISVINKTGAKNYKSLSGGEKRKVNLACILALQDLASTRADKSFDLWIGDEIDDALDTVGLELLMAVLNEKAQEKGTVLVISHNDLKDWISQNIVVTKQNKVSTIQE